MTKADQRKAKAAVRRAARDNQKLVDTPMKPSRPVQASTKLEPQGATKPIETSSGVSAVTVPVKTAPDYIKDKSPAPVANTTLVTAKLAMTWSSVTASKPQVKEVAPEASSSKAAIGSSIERTDTRKKILLTSIKPAPAAASEKVEKAPTAPWAVKEGKIAKGPVPATTNTERTRYDSGIEMSSNDSSSSSSSEDNEPVEIPLLPDGKTYFFPQCDKDPVWQQLIQLSKDQKFEFFGVKPAPTSTHSRSWAEIFDPDRMEKDEDYGSTFYALLEQGEADVPAYKQAGQAQPMAVQLLSEVDSDSQPEPEDREVCPFWKRGDCMFGDKCRNYHPDRKGTLEEDQKVWSFWKREECVWG